VARTLVFLQFLTIGCLLWPPRVAAYPWLAGFVAALGALLLGWTLSANRPGNFRVLPAPKAGASLATTGPYRWVRHPMYLASLLLMAGAVLWGPATWKAPVWLLLAVVLTAKARREERGLLSQFPEYAAYRARRRFLIPGIW
jgi:protein-S-isoprenylcysteine O-methyltransferase Ste14